MIRGVSLRGLLLAALIGCSPGIVDPANNGHGNGTDPVLEPTGDRVGDATRAATAALRRGDLAAAVGAVEPLRDDDPPEARDLLLTVRFLSGALPPEWSTLLPLLARTLDTAMVQALQRTLSPGEPPGDYVHTRVALFRVHARGDPAPAQALTTRVVSAPLRAALRRVVDRDTARRTGAQPKTLGVLLPLSGPYRGLGEAALRSIQLALGSRSGIRLVVKDTRGDAGAAARLVDDLVFESGVVGILGPIGAFESTAASRRATELGVPALVLSAREGIVQAGATVLRTRVTPSRQGVRLARYAVNEMGLKRFGMLISDSPYGWALSGAFWSEVVRLGGDVTAAVTYPRGTKAYKDIVRQLLGATSGRGGGGRGHASFQALLIADDQEAVRKLVPYFPYWGMRVRRVPRARRGVQLLGGDSWNHHGIVDEAEQQTDNAVFCDSFFPDETNPRVERFVNSFFRKYREPPTAFEAEVYDAAQIMAGALRSSTSTTRLGLLEALRGTRSYKGVTGVLRFDDSGEVVKDVIILTIEGDAIRPRNSEEEERAIRGGAR